MVFAGGGGYLEPEVPVSDELRDLIRQAIEETAARGDAVIVAHAASHALAARADALRVLVTASPATRCARVAAEQGLSEKDAAAHRLGRRTRTGLDYLKRFFGEKSELPTQYDVVVNTDRLSPAEAASIVTVAAAPRLSRTGRISRQPPFRRGPPRAALTTSSFSTWAKSAYQNPTAPNRPCSCGQTTSSASRRSSLHALSRRDRDRDDNARRALRSRPADGGDHRCAGREPVVDQHRRPAAKIERA